MLFSWLEGCVGFCGGLQCRGTAWRQLFVFDLRAELGCTWCYRVRVCVVALGNWQLGIRFGAVVCLF